MSALWRQRTHCLCLCHPGTQQSADAGSALNQDLLLELNCLLWGGLTPPSTQGISPSAVQPLWSCSAHCTVGLSPRLYPPSLHTGWGLGRLWPQVCNLRSDHASSLRIVTSQGMDPGGDDRAGGGDRYSPFLSPLCPRLTPELEADALRAVLLLLSPGVCHDSDQSTAWFP